MILPRVMSVLRVVDRGGCVACEKQGRHGWLVDLLPARPNTSESMFVWDEEQSVPSGAAKRGDG
jgi:hypothetical protein